MAAVFQELNETYRYIVESGDPRGNEYPLVSTPITTISTIFLYITFIQLAPRYYKHKAALDIKPVIIAYNLVMVLLSAYMFKEFVTSAYLIGYNLVCQPTESSTAPSSMRSMITEGFPGWTIEDLSNWWVAREHRTAPAWTAEIALDVLTVMSIVACKRTLDHLQLKLTRMVRVSWLFYISKIFELSDTIFMVVRKKGQLSFLHVFHHSTVIFHQWVFIKYIPSSHAVFQAALNCFIHFFMYSYFFLACFPKLQKYLWWKKYLTMMQMVQFVLIIVHAVSGYYYACGFPRWAALLCLSECGVLFILFGNYYIQTHLKKRKADLKTKLEKSN